jgi:hypothetical protein
MVLANGPLSLPWAVEDVRFQELVALAPGYAPRLNWHPSRPLDPRPQTTTRSRLVWVSRPRLNDHAAEVSRSLSHSIVVP